MTDSQYCYFLQAIRDHSGLELASIREAGEHGADTGWSGFTYTSDGAEFTRAHRSEVWDLLYEDSVEFGCESVAEFVGSFARADMAVTPDGFDCLLAWYVLESVGQFASDRRTS